MTGMLTTGERYRVVHPTNSGFDVGEVVTFVNYDADGDARFHSDLHGTWWLNENGVAPLLYDDRFGEVIGSLTDATHDATTVVVHDGEVHVTIMDQTMADGMDEDHEPDGGWPDTARGVYTIEQARELRGLLAKAIEVAQS